VVTLAYCVFNSMCLVRSIWHIGLLMSSCKCRVVPQLFLMFDALISTQLLAN